MNTRPPHDDVSAGPAGNPAGVGASAPLPVEGAACGYAGQVHAFHDGELAPDVKSAVEGHLAACPACRAELARLRRLSLLLSAPAASLSDVQVDHAMDRVLATLRQARVGRPVSGARAADGASEITYRRLTAKTAPPDASVQPVRNAQSAVPREVIRLIRGLTAVAAAVLVGGLLMLYREAATSVEGAAGPDPASVVYIWQQNSSAAPDDTATAEGNQLRFAQWIVNDLSANPNIGPRKE